MPRETGKVITFNVLKADEFIAAALCISNAEFLALSGFLEQDQSPPDLPETLGLPNVARLEVDDSSLEFSIGDESIPVFSKILLGHTNWCPYHWWIYTGRTMLISCYDWDAGPNFAHKSILPWLENLAADDVVAILGTHEFTDEWYAMVERIEKEAL